MSCTPDIYGVTTSPNLPARDGVLTVYADGSATFAPTVGAGGFVNVHCGSDKEGDWMEFTDTNVNPSVHYHKAYRQPNGSYSGSVDNSAKKQQDPETWTAAPANIPRPHPHEHEHEHGHTKK